jgi:hypothetical protein
MGPANDAPHRLIEDVVFGERVVVYSFVNLYGCRIGSDTRIGAFVEVARGAEIGERCKIQSHSYICDGVRIGDLDVPPIEAPKLDPKDRRLDCVEARGAARDVMVIPRAFAVRNAFAGLRRGNFRRPEPVPGCSRPPFERIGRCHRLLARGAAPQKDRRQRAVSRPWRAAAHQLAEEPMHDRFT